MNSGYNIYEEIDLYLKGKLTGEQLQLFQKRLEEDKGFADGVEHQKIANKIIFAKELGSLKEKIGQDLQSNPPGSSLFRKIILTSIAVLAVSSSAYYFNSNKTEHKTETINTKESISSKEDVAKSPVAETNEVAQKQLPKEELMPKPPINSIGKVKADSTITLNINQTKTEIEVKEEKSIDSTKTAQEKKESNKEIPSVIKKTDCTNENIIATSDVTSTCKGKAEGIIIINTSQIKGGIPPYTFSFNKENNYSSDNVYSNLKSGNYKIYIRDKNNCIGEVTVKVQEKNCESVINEVFNPYYELWKIPVTENTETEIKIFSEAGVLVYSKNIPSGYEAEWDGKDLKGEQLANGMYAFVISGKDGSVIKGYISIMY